MNVLVVIDKLSIDGLTPSCIALNLRDTHAVFSARDIHLTVCCLRGTDPGADLLEAAGVATLRLGRAPFSPRVASDLTRAARQCAADVLHAHGYAAANFGRLVGHRLQLPVVVHEHAVLRVRPHQWLADRLCRRWTTQGLAVSGAVAEFMVRGRGIPRARIEILHNGVDLERFYRLEALPAAECRRHFGWPESGPLIGSVARFRREKGLDVLLAAAAKVIARCPDAHFVLAGEGPERLPLQREAKRRGLSARIFFPGFIEDVPRLMRSLSVLAIPSHSEGFPFAALEAMASGVPIVASRVGGLPEVITDGVNGLLCPAGDAGALAAALVRLLEDTDLRTLFSRQGRNDSKKYSMEHYVDHLAALYHRLLSAPREAHLGTVADG